MPPKNLPTIVIVGALGLATPAAQVSISLDIKFVATAHHKAPAILAVRFDMPEHGNDQEPSPAPVPVPLTAQVTTSASSISGVWIAPPPWA
jgi:hypothetical protein